MTEEPEYRPIKKSDDGYPIDPWRFAEEVTTSLQDDAGPANPKVSGRPELADIRLAKVLRMARRDRETLISLYEDYTDPSGTYTEHPAETIGRELGA